MRIQAKWGCIGNPAGHPGRIKKQAGYKPDCAIEVTPHYG